MTGRRKIEILVVHQENCRRLKAMGLFQWLKKLVADRSYRHYLEREEWILALHERDLLLKMARTEWKIKKIRLKRLRREEKVRKKRGSYID